MVSRGFCQRSHKECWSHDDAQNLATKTRRRSKTRVQAYRCKFCSFWHIGGEHVRRGKAAYSRKTKYS